MGESEQDKKNKSMDPAQTRIKYMQSIREKFLKIKGPSVNVSRWRGS